MELFREQTDDRVRRRGRPRMYPQLHDRDWLEQRYVRDGLTVQQIADEIGCSRQVLNRSLTRFGIPRRPQGVPKGTPASPKSIAANRRNARQIQHRNSVLVRDTARRLGQFTTAELMAATGLTRPTIRKYLRLWEAQGTVSPPTYSWNFEKPTAETQESARGHGERVEGWKRSGTPATASADLPPNKDMRALVTAALRTGATCTRTGADHFTLRLPNGATVTLPGTPSSSRTVANKRAEIKRAYSKEAP